MRYFIVVDENGNPVYYDHPDGPMLYMILSQTQNLLLENFGEQCTSWLCGSTLFIFGRFQNLFLMIVSDGGESERVLQNQLKIIYDLLLFVFGPTV